MNGRISLCAALLSLSVIGCGGGVGDYPDMGSVSGTVTMDGNAVANASVIFVPKEAGGRSSFATTDSSGYYELQYSANMEGARIGEHTVKVSTYRSPDPNVDGDTGAAETIPNKFNSKSELTKKVESGSNTIDLELTSDGEIDKHDNQNPDYESDN